MGLGLGNSMDVSKNMGKPPKSSILIGVFHDNKPSILGGFPTIFGNIHMGIVWGPKSPIIIGGP